MKKLVSVFLVVTVVILGSWLMLAQAPPAQQGQRGQGGGAPGGGGGQQQPQNPMSFFVTSVGSGDGANLGGLAGADALCTRLANAQGAGNPNAPHTGKTWRAYLSTQAQGNQPAVNARDRIGSGPWYNSRNAMIARNVSHLHGDTLEEARLGNNLKRNTALNEKGQEIPGVPVQGAQNAPPNQHDILTGSTPEGRAFTDGMDHTCQNWTSNRNFGQGEQRTSTAQLGHADRTGGQNLSWNSAHASQGCSQANLVATGGAGLLYCFAIN
jgi:hypothetical protein